MPFVIKAVCLFHLLLQSEYEVALSEFVLLVYQANFMLNLKRNIAVDDVLAELLDSSESG